MNLVFTPLFFTSRNAFLTGSVVTIVEGCIISPQLSNLYFTVDNVCNVLSIMYSTLYIISVFSLYSSDAALSFPFGGGGADVEDVKSNASLVNFS